MKVLAVMNVKGGVGKTTTAVNLAEILAAENGRRVLLIDADAQGDATYLLSQTEGEAVSGTYGALALSDSLDNVIEPTRFRNLDLMGGDADLFYLSMDSSTAVTRAMEGLIRSLDDPEDAECAYDAVIIDCPPSFSAVSVAALAVADLVIIPTCLDALSLKGVRFLMRQLETIHEVASEATWAGVLPTMYHRCEVCDQALALIQTSGLPMLETVIRRTDKVMESTFYAQSLGEYSRRSAAGQDYRRLAGQLMERLFGEEAADNG